MVVVTNANPRPAAASSDGPRMSVRKPPPTETCENHASAVAIISIPIASTGLKPILVTSWDATPAETMIPRARGTYERPAWIAL